MGGGTTALAAAASSAATGHSPSSSSSPSPSDATAAAAEASIGGSAAPQDKAVAAMVVDDNNEEEASPPPAEGPCRVDGCGVVSPFRCRQCGLAFYCSRAHQREDWVRPLPDGKGRGGHHLDCTPRAWLPAAVAVPALPWANAQGPGGGAGEEEEEGKQPPWNEEEGAGAPKRARVDGGQEDYMQLGLGAAGDGDGGSGSGIGGGGGAGDGNPQAMWSGHVPVPGSAAAAAFGVPSCWKEGGAAQGGDEGAGTQPLSTLDGSMIPIAPMDAGFGGFTGSDLPPAIHPAGFDGPSTVPQFPLVPALPAATPPQQQPEEGAVVQLMEMGFEEADARSALVVHNNDVGRACDYLLSSGEGDAMGGSNDAFEAAARTLASHFGDGEGAALPPGWEIGKDAPAGLPGPASQS